MPGTWDVERGPAYGLETVDRGMVELLVHLVALIRGGRVVVVELHDDGRWRSSDPRIAELLNDCSGAEEYRTRLQFVPHRLVGVAHHVARFFGGTIQEYVTPRQYDPAVNY